MSSDHFEQSKRLKGSCHPTTSRKAKGLMGVGKNYKLKRSECLMEFLGSPSAPHPPHFNTSVPHKRATPFQPQNSSVPHQKPLSSTPKPPHFNTPLSFTPKTTRFHTKNPQFYTKNLPKKECGFWCGTEGGVWN